LDLSAYPSKTPCGPIDMLYEITDETVVALKNLLILARETYENKKHIIDADDVITAMSVDEVEKIINAWEHEEKLWSGTNR